MDDEKYLHAKKVYLDKKFEEANSLFSEIIASTNNYMAVIYKGFNSAFQTTIDTPHHVDMVAGIKQGYEIVRSLEEKPFNYVDNNLEVITELNKFVIFSIQLYLNKYNYEYNEYVTKKKKTNDYDKYSGNQTNTKYVDKTLKEIEENYEREKNNYMAGISLTAISYSSCMDIVLQDVLSGNNEIYTLELYKTLLSITKSIFARFRDCKLGEPLLSKVKKYYDFCNNKVGLLQTGKNNEYWESHKEERAELENKVKTAKETINQKEEEIINLNESKKKLTLDLSTSVSYNKQQEFKEKLNSVNKSIESLGKFDIKSKKELNEEKAKLEDIIRRLDNNIKSEKEEVESKFYSEKKAIDDKINQLQNDIINLKREIDSNEKLLNQDR